MSAGEDSELQEELVALQFTYGEENVQGSYGVVDVNVNPNTGGDQHQQYVAAKLRFWNLSSYPAQPPSMSLVQCKGMSNASCRAFLVNGCTLVHENVTVQS